MQTLLQDMRYGIRMLVKNPGFTAIAVLTLALGIGANTAMFSVVNAVLLNPLPFPQSHRLVAVSGTHSRLKETGRALSFPDIQDLRAQNSVFEHLAPYTEAGVAVYDGKEARHLHAAAVGEDMFSVLEVPPILGRTFLPGEDLPGHYVTVISYQLWQDQFHGDPRAVGSAVSVDGRSYTVVGVMPGGFTFPLDADSPQMWMTFSAEATPGEDGRAQTDERDSHFLHAVARLKPGITLAQANQETQIIGQRLEKQYPDMNTYVGMQAESALDALVSKVRPQLYILLGAVGLVLLIACANVANLLLARATGRQREIAIRAALGAGRKRIVRQLLIESGMMSLAGGIAGLLVAVWGAGFLSRLAADQIPRLTMTGVDFRVLAFTLIVSLVTGLLFGIAPALQLSRMQLTEALKESSRGAGHSSHQNRLRNLLVVAEMTLAVILLTGAGLLIRSLKSLEHVNPGFNPGGLITWTIDLPDSRYSKHGQPEAFFRTLFERVRAIPGVRSASGVVPLPLSDENIRTVYEVEGRSFAKGEAPRVYFRAVEDDYFQTMEIPLLRGRDFTRADIHGATDVVIVNKAVAERSFPGEDPIGKRIKPGVGENGVEPWRQIVGVVGDVKHRRLDLPDDPECYAPEEQVGWGQMFGVVRSDVPGASLIPAIREQVRSIDKDVPIYDVRTMDEYVSRSVLLPRLDSTLLAIFAALALLLAVVGVYGVISYGVAQRTNEIGIRMTLGAQQKDVLRLVLRQGLKIAGLGVAMGLAGALGATRLLASLLFGVSPSDPVTFATVALVLAACALAACYIPAWRASRVDPMVALRYE